MGRGSSIPPSQKLSPPAGSAPPRRRTPWLTRCSLPGMTVTCCGSSTRRRLRPRPSCSASCPRPTQRWPSGGPSMRRTPSRGPRSWRRPSESRAAPHPNSKRGRSKRTSVETGRVGMGGRFKREDRKWGEMWWATEVLGREPGSCTLSDPWLAPTHFL